MTPIFYCLVGVPGSGKSTWIETQHFDLTTTAIISTDFYVEAEAKRLGKTYDQVFSDVMPNAVQWMADDVRVAVAQNKSIVWDQTSTTILSRRKKFRMIPKNYHKVAVVFPTPEMEELARRLAGRLGKNIPSDVVNSMIAGFVMPTIEEGFDEVRVIE